MFLALCDGMKREGVLIYTIAIDVPSWTTSRRAARASCPETPSTTASGIARPSIRKHEGGRGSPEHHRWGPLGGTPDQVTVTATDIAIHPLSVWPAAARSL